MHERLKDRDPAPDFLAAWALSPERAEPPLWLCWHYHAALERCGVDDRVCHLQNRVAAYYYARAAAALPYPSGVRPQLWSVQQQIHFWPSKAWAAQRLCSGCGWR